MSKTQKLQAAISAWEQAAFKARAFQGGTPEAWKLEEDLRGAMMAEIAAVGMTQTGIRPDGRLMLGEGYIGRIGYVEIVRGAHGWSAHFTPTTTMRSAAKKAAVRREIARTIDTQY